ncbi:hypothetical protein FFI97_006025 [Variovorax sp. KBS0712]|uniref:hypothetical protein n=1 Tax=Variovorax sp. KBS0712 TaxID=2578111 RepID=UPI00111A0433|nr:hypothetical protein [Variovorax sp. KBS0712]TSD59866.1 hypothetical protein FFI97_006025 [Variovorax sp. KBS0712]
MTSIPVPSIEVVEPDPTSRVLGVVAGGQIKNFWAGPSFAQLAADDGATKIGTPEGPVQAALDARPTTTDLAQAGASHGLGSVLAEVGAQPMTAAEALGLRYNLWNFLTEAERVDSASGSPTIDVSAKINTAIQRAVAAGRPLDAFGTYRVGAQKIVFLGDADFSKAKFIVYGAPAIAMEVSTGSAANPTDVLSNVVVHLPYRTENAAKPVPGWGGQGIGARTVNTQSCRIYTGNITGFAIGFRETSYGTNGNVYNEIYIGHLENNQINLDLVPGATTSWVNENNHFGGRFSHYSGEGINVAGTRHIKFDKGINSVNNNAFYKPSIEGNTAEYHVENCGAYNTLVSARWEASPPKLLYNGDMTTHGNRNFVLGGYGVQDVVVSYAGTTGGANLLVGAGVEKQEYVEGRAVANRGGADLPYDLFYEGGTKPETAGVNEWSMRHTSQTLRGKRKADVSERMRLDYVNGRIYLGNGTAAPVAWLQNLGNTNVGVNTSFAPNATGSLDLGLTSLKWQHVYLTGSVGFFGSAPVTAKPSVSGSRGGNAALADLITKLASFGLITDSTTA